jgi:hypothetical protein
MYVIPLEQCHQPQRWLFVGQLLLPVIVQQKQLVPSVQQAPVPPQPEHVRAMVDIAD